MSPPERVSERYLGLISDRNKDNGKPYRAGIVGVWMGKNGEGLELIRTCAQLMCTGAEETTLTVRTRSMRSAAMRHSKDVDHLKKAHRIN